MSVRLPQNEDFSNDYDNSDLVVDRNISDIAQGYSAYDEVLAYKTYLETLKLEAELEKTNAVISIPQYTKNGKLLLDKDGKPEKPKTYEIKRLMGRRGEFENKRRLVLMKLNDMDDKEIKQTLAEYECESIFTLSNKITNSMIDKGRRENIFEKFDFEKI